MVAIPIPIPIERVHSFCRQHRISRLSLFGSVLREDFTPQSDIDVLVQFQPGTQIGYFGLMQLQDELSNMLGRSVDLHTPASLNERFREKVCREAATLYVAA